MDNQNVALAKETNAKNSHGQHFSDGSELIPSEVAAKGLTERDKPLTPESEMKETTGKANAPSSPNVEPAYRVTDSGLINAYPVSPPISEIDPNSKKQFRRNLIGFGLAANLALALIVIALSITGRF
ncbi:hypothetical protein [Synechocystis sp. CACIAM 05]|uniref:hypothetical protein n=1 Tax=Synechocystis sp. CACIAM 05 TaxID=1933929 RepID=UPI001F29D171|nr:hypothetical protein [Synechocystis sp. CACIAM 05]